MKYLKLNRPRPFASSVSLGRAVTSLRPLLTAYADILFLGDPRLGLGVLGLTFVDANVGCCGLTAAASALAFSRLLGRGAESGKSHAGLVNSTLTGIVFGTLVRLDASAGLWLALLSVATFLLTLAIQSVLAPLGVMLFSLPFSLIALVMRSLLPRMASLYVIRPGIGGPEVPAEGATSALEALLAGLGNLFGGHSLWVGLIILALFSLRSRFMLLSAIVGLGVAWGMDSELNRSLAGAGSHFLVYNQALAAIAVGAIYMVPSLRATLLSALAAALTVLYGAALEALTGAESLYTVPFFLAVGTLLLTLRQLGERTFAERPDLPAERNLERYLSVTHRFALQHIHLGNPLLGRWKVSQGREGRFTHQAPWNEAIDFVLCDDQGRSCRGAGKVLSDYYGFNRPVLSPVTGYVVDVVNERPDCALGSVDTTYPWGNYIEIRTLDGFYVVLAHLGHGSVPFSAGQYIVEGTPVGTVGNSGYSPEPHLHLHVQSEARIGSPTLPFRFASHAKGSQIQFSAFPSERDTVEFLVTDPTWERWFTFLLDERLVFQGANGRREVLDVRMEPGTGLFYFIDSRGNRLHFSRNRHFFSTFRYEGKRGTLLESLHAALPRVPLYGRGSMSWTDTLPISLAYSRAGAIGAYALAAWITARPPQHGQFDLSSDGAVLTARTRLHGRAVTIAVHFSATRGLEELRVDRESFRLIARNPESRFLSSPHEPFLPVIARSEEGPSQPHSTLDPTARSRSQAIESAAELEETTLERQRRLHDLYTSSKTARK